MDNVIDKLLLEWSWRCEKGYPDINNPKDIKILGEIFNINLAEVKSYNDLSTDARTVATTIVNALGLTTKDVKYSSKNRFTVVAPLGIRRKDLIEKLQKQAQTLGIQRDHTLSTSSIGGFVHTNTGVQIIFKDSVTASLGAAGKENEAFFTAKLNSFLEEGPKTVILKSDVKEITIQNVVKVEDISKPEDKSAKADVLLHTEAGKVPLSIKEDGPFRWASAMTTFREMLEQFVQKGLKGDITGVRLVQDVNKPALLLMQDSKGKPYSKIYIVDFPLLEENLEYYLFGSDEAKVVQRSFTDNDFLEQDNTVIVNCTNLFTETEEVPEEYLPIIRLERNATHATSTTNPTRRGIQLRIVPMFLKNEGERSNTLTLNWKTDILQK
jgi:hypothetical protein